MKKILVAILLACASPQARAVLPAAPSRTVVTAAGGTIVYFSFKTTSASHIEVFVAPPPAPTYSVTLNANQDSSPGGYITFTSPPAAGAVVTVQRTRPLSQDSVWTFNKPLENALDALAMQIQQVDRRVSEGGGGGGGGGGVSGPVYWQDILGAPTTWAWNSITGKPATFTPATHTHPLNQISGIAGVADSSTYLRGDGVWATPPGGGGGGGAPVDANYITILPNSTLSAERVLTPGNGMVLNYDTSSVTVGLNTGIQFLVGASSGALSGAYKVVPTCPPGKALTYDGATLSCIASAITPPTSSALGGVLTPADGSECRRGYHLSGVNLATGQLICRAIGYDLVAVTTTDGNPPADPNQEGWIDLSGGSSPTVGIPMFTPVPGSFTGTQNVALSTNTVGADICFTTNGVPPAAATAGACSVGARYTGPITMAASGTIKALGTKVGYVNSAVVDGAYTITLGDTTVPVVTTFIPASTSTSLYITWISSDFTATDNVGVTEWAVTRGACSTATGWSTTKPVNYKVVGSGNYTLRGCAKDAAGNISTGLASVTTTVTAAPDAPVMNTITTPAASPVTISGTAAVGAEYAYTVRIYRSDAPGTPVKTVAVAAGNTAWSTSVSTGDGLGAGTYTLYATAVQSGSGLESAASAAQTITVTTTTTAATPTITPNGGTISGATSVTLACTSPSPTIKYTTDGSTPTGASLTYTSALSVSTPTTVKAICQSFGLTDSPVASASFVYANAAAPTFSPVAGTYTGAQTVTASTITSGADICYTTDGSDPAAATPGTCSHGTQVASGSTFSVSASGTLKALATKAGMANSGITTAAYTIVANTPTISPNGGTISGTTSVALACGAPSPTIRYTTDGSTPNGSSTVYSGAFNVSVTTTVKAICQSSGMTDSAVASATFTLTVSIVDDFNRADGTAADGTHLWVVAPGYSGHSITILSNKAVGSGGYGSAYWNQALGSTAYAWAKVQSSGDAVKLRIKPSDSAATFYGFSGESSDNTVQILRYANGSGGVVASAASGLSTGVYWPYIALTVTDNGNGTVTLRGYVKNLVGDAWTEKVSYTDSTPLTGDKPGVGVNPSPTGSIDDFHAGEGALP